MGFVLAPVQDGHACWVDAQPVATAQLSPRRAAVLQAIDRHITVYGYAPSLREIGAAVGLSGMSSVDRHVRHLERVGLLRRPGRRGQPGSLTLVQPGDAA